MGDKYSRFCLVNRRDVKQQITRNQKSLDKMHIALSLEKDLRHQPEDVIFSRLEAIQHKYRNRCDLRFLQNTISELLREYHFDRALHLFIPEYKCELSTDFITLPMHYLNDIIGHSDKMVPIVVEINTIHAMYCVSVSRFNDYFVLETNLVHNNKYRHSYTFIYDTINFLVYVVTDTEFIQDNPDMEECIAIEVNGHKFPVRPIGYKEARVSIPETSDMYGTESIVIDRVALLAIHDYMETVKEMDKYARPSTVTKHRERREKVADTVVIEKDTSNPRRVNDVYIKLSEIIEKRTGRSTGTGTQHSSHASPCEHYRRATTRRLKSGRVVPVRGTTVNKGKGNPVVKTVVVDNDYTEPQ